MYITQGFVVFFVPLGEGDAVIPPPPFCLSLSVSALLGLTFPLQICQNDLSLSYLFGSSGYVFVPARSMQWDLAASPPYTLASSRRMHKLLMHDISLRQVADASSALAASIFLDMVMSPKEGPLFLLGPSHISSSLDAECSSPCAKQHGVWG